VRQALPKIDLNVDDDPVQADYRAGKNVCEHGTSLEAIMLKVNEDFLADDFCAYFFQNGDNHQKTEVSQTRNLRGWIS
jgi:hypothetical protein